MCRGKEDDQEKLKSDEKYELYRLIGEMTFVLNNKRKNSGRREALLCFLFLTVTSEERGPDPAHIYLFYFLSYKYMLSVIFSPIFVFPLAAFCVAAFICAFGCIVSQIRSISSSDTRHRSLTPESMSELAAEEEEDPAAAPEKLRLEVEICSRS